MGNNYIPYSSYSASGWTCDTASDAGAISLGPLGHNSVAYVDSDNDVQEKNGSQTWEDSGTFRSIVGVDVSSATTFVLSAQVGAYHYGTQNLTVAMGFCDSSGNNKSQQREFSVAGSKMCWFLADPSDIAAPLSSSDAYFYFTVTASSGQKWYVDMIRLEFNVTRPSNTFLRTNGASVSYTTDKVQLGAGKVCPKCFEHLMRLTWSTPPKERPPKSVRTRMEHP